MKTLKNNHNFISFGIKVFLGISFCLFVIFVYSRSEALIQGPTLIFEEPHENLITVTEPLVTIRGTAKYASELMINGALVFMDEEGNFSETLSVYNGTTDMHILAKSKYGKTNEHLFSVYYEPSYETEQPEQPLPESRLTEITSSSS